MRSIADRRTITPDAGQICGMEEVRRRRDSTMTRYEIEQTDAGLAIQIDGIGDRRDDLLAAFAECQQGQCSCPTREYEKVDAMEVTQSGDAISISLHPKAGVDFDAREIAACLDYTVARTGE
jgi:hypothetical protein